MLVENPKKVKVALEGHRNLELKDTLGVMGEIKNDKKMYLLFGGDWGIFCRRYVSTLYVPGLGGEDGEGDCRRNGTRERCREFGFGKGE